MCTVMPLSLHHVADEVVTPDVSSLVTRRLSFAMDPHEQVVTLDVDFNLELTFGDVIHSRVFQLKSQRRPLLPPPGRDS